MPRITRPSVWRAAATLPIADEEIATAFLCEHLGSAVTSYSNLETRRATIAIYLSDRKSWAETAKNLSQSWPKAMPFPFPRFSLARVRRQDWAESWKRHFKPMCIGSRLWIRPSWAPVKLQPGQLEVVLDPGLSFGTGQHPTTSFCLCETLRHRQAGVPQSFLDIGTGSGILAITAAKLGYAPVEAFDLDSEAVAIAQNNARKNKVSRKIHFAVRDVSAGAGERPVAYSVVCANLISDVIIKNANRMLKRVAPGGIFVAAGILAVEFEEVRKALEERGWVLIRSKHEKEWRSGSFCRKP